eukprot:8100061-Heterocapsa_arctica.AAC.1
MICRLGSRVQGNLGTKENGKASIIVTNKEVVHFNPFNVRKDSGFKGNGQQWPGAHFLADKSNKCCRKAG